MKCPICKKDVPEAKPGETPFFPFCSDRCKLVDLNRWLTGKYQIPIREDEDGDSLPRMDTNEHE
jgi:hypothetical protein